MKQEKGQRVVVRIIKPFNKPAAAIFDAWLNTALLSQWMFGPSVRDEAIVSLYNDPRPGGRFSYKVKRGDQVLDHIGTYLKVERPTCLVFTWGIATDSGDDSVVTILIEPAGEECTLTLEHDMDIKWSAYAERTEAGWTFMLKLLGERLPVAGGEK